nr:TraR/DksA C4-type zinc finger protein [Paraoerskovia sediminicola]
MHALRRSTTSRLASLRAESADIVEAARGQNGDDEHDPDGATVAFERAQVLALTRDAQTLLAEVDAAIARVDRGTYGVCEACGERIPAARLDARPTARACVGCA